ncbi:MAG TPA: hypothetical protein VD903_19685 [Pseudonocardia sp.]|nr:hypothetical protein [Pseudonocardia sp.]
MLDVDRVQPLADLRVAQPLRHRVGDLALAFGLARTGRPGPDALMRRLVYRREAA